MPHATHSATVSLAAGDAALTPPVHPNCRCTIGADGVWYDAQDARVCPTCMLLGASWNLQLDIPMDEGEVARILDEKTLADFKAAVERDELLTNRVVEQVVEQLDSGVAKQAVESAEGQALLGKAKKARAQLEKLKALRATLRAEAASAASEAKAALPEEARAAVDAAIAADAPLADKTVDEIIKSKAANGRAIIDKLADTARRLGPINDEIVAAQKEIKAADMRPLIEREIVKARAAARAAAPIQAGRIIPGLGTAPDALVFETTPVGKVARLVSVNVASGAAYRVIWRGGKYLLQTVGGRTIDSGGDLWWLLLLLALLEKKRRDEEERRKAQEAARSQA